MRNDIEHDPLLGANFMVALPLELLLYALEAAILSAAWGWFLAASLGSQPPGAAGCLGIVLALRVLVPRLETRDVQDPVRAMIDGVLVRAFVFGLMSLLHLLM